MDPSLFSDLLSEFLNQNSGFFFRKGKLLEQGKTPYQEYEVWDTPELGRLFRLDGYFMTSERDEFFYHENMIHPALVSHPEPKKVLIIGGGDGGSADEVFKHPSIERIVLVELDEAVVNLSRKYFARVHHGSLDDPRIEIRIEDGLHYVRTVGPTNGELFDLIVLDLTDPWGPAAELIHHGLWPNARTSRPGGMFVLHIGPPSRTDACFGSFQEPTGCFFRSLHRTLSIFPSMEVSGNGMCLWTHAIQKKWTKRWLMQSSKNRSLADLQYYNGAVHEAVFALPEFLKKILYS
jgi:spermidine synthase